MTPSCNVDFQFLLQAVCQAKQAMGQCSPNPTVGAVVVKNRRIIGSGFHAGPGQAHAEIAAFRQASESLQGGTLYVTLEPCCHHGRTPPCTDAIIQQGIVRVVYGYEDPNPQVAGKGIVQLRAHNIACEKMQLPEITELYRSYHYWHQTKKPWMRLKLAMTADGMIAYQGGKPARITNSTTNQFTMRQRQKADAILTSVRTIINDDPAFTVRINGDVRLRYLYIIDRKCQLPLPIRCLKTAREVIVLHASDVDIKQRERLVCHGVRCIPCDGLSQMLSIMGQEGRHEVWIECGATLSRLWIEEKLINEFFLYVSAKKLNTKGMPHQFDMHSIKNINETPLFKKSLSDFELHYQLHSKKFDAEWDDAIWHFYFVPKIRSPASPKPG